MCERDTHGTEHTGYLGAEVTDGCEPLHLGIGN